MTTDLKSPLIHAHGKIWIKHTPGRPRPCEPDALVHVLFRDTQIMLTDEPIRAGFCLTWESKVIGWRYAELSKPTPAPEAWQPAVGDVVRLKSGGPAMTVAELRDHNAACDWFHEGERDTGLFPLATLIKAKEVAV